MDRLSRVKLVLLSVVGWTFVALYFAAQAHFNTRPRLLWSRAFLINVTVYYLWGLCTPIVIWLALRYDFRKGQVTRALLVHLGASVVLTVMQLVATEMVLSMIFARRTSPLMERLSSMVGLNFQGSLPTYWLILFVWLAIDYQAKLRHRELEASQLEAQLSQAQLHALRMQLNPHFLFNTLNSISSLMYSDVESADAMMARLSEFLRLTVDRDIAQEIPLEQEVEFVRRYLEIEKVRFEKRLRVTIDVSPEASRASVPSLALQPLVENAIHHGIAARREGGTIEIRAECSDQSLHLSVADDGVGAREQGREGVGLANTRTRLERLYGSGQHLEVTNLQPRGFRVDIVIPYRHAAVA